MANNNEQLVRKSSSNPDEAFKDLIEQHRERVYRFVLSQGVPESEADDAAQEVFLQVVRSLRSFRGESSFTTWLYAIARNVAAGHRRKRAQALARQAPLDGNPECLEIPDGRRAHDEVLETQERDKIVRDAINSLGPMHRDVLLKQSEGYSYRQMADWLGIPAGTVRSRLHHAKRAAAAILALALAAACGRKAIDYIGKAMQLNRWGKWQEAAQIAGAAAEDRALSPDDRCALLVDSAYANARLGRDQEAWAAGRRFSRDCGAIPKDSWMRGELRKLEAEYTLGSPEWLLKRAMTLNQTGDWPLAALAADAVLGAPDIAAHQRCEALFDKSYAATRFGHKSEGLDAVRRFDGECGSIPKGDWTRREIAKLKSELNPRPKR
ncbi:MAG: RNA polymerase sigma factor [Elusimicrobia bacterium]|nr:RNA polymerase sigma factor [Elusimicrobiota bacterium]